MTTWPSEAARTPSLRLPPSGGSRFPLPPRNLLSRPHPRVGYVFCDSAPPRPPELPELFLPSCNLISLALGATRGEPPCVYSVSGPPE